MPGPDHQDMSDRREHMTITSPLIDRGALSYFRGADGKYYTDDPLLIGPLNRRQLDDAIIDLFRESRGALSKAPEAPSPAVTEDLQPPPPTSEKLLADIAQSLYAVTLQESDASSLEELLDTTSLEEPFTASPPTVLHNTIDCSPSISPSRCEKLVEGAAALTLHDPNISSSEELIDTTSLEEPFTACPTTVPLNIIAASSAFPSSCEKLVTGAAESASALNLQEPDDSSLEEFLDSSWQESITASPRTVPHNTIVGLSSTFSTSWEIVVAGAADSTSTLTLQEPNVSSLDEILDSSSEELITASPRTVPHNTHDGSSSIFPSRLEKLVEGAATLTLHDPNISSSEELIDTTSEEESITASPWTVPYNTTDSSPPSASSLGSPIYLRCPPNWYQQFYIRMDRGGSFHVYPYLGGPFQSLQEAEDAINHHLYALELPAMREGRHKLSLVDWQMQQYLFYPDGTPRRGPNSPARKNPHGDELQLVQALLHKYNDDHDLSTDLAHELKDLVDYQWIFENPKTYFHFNFTTKTKKADNDNLFFAEVSRSRSAKDWVVNCCCMIEPIDNGTCRGCIKYGSPKIRHPNNTHAFTGGHVGGYLPFGGDESSDSDEDEDAVVHEQRIMFERLVAQV